MALTDQMLRTQIVHFYVALPSKVQRLKFSFVQVVCYRTLRYENLRRLLLISRGTLTLDAINSSCTIVHIAANRS